MTGTTVRDAIGYESQVSAKATLKAIVAITADETIGALVAQRQSNNSNYQQTLRSMSRFFLSAEERQARNKALSQYRKEIAGIDAQIDEKVDQFIKQQSQPNTAYTELFSQIDNMVDSFNGQSNNLLSTLVFGSHSDRARANSQRMLRELIHREEFKPSPHWSAVKVGFGVGTVTSIGYALFYTLAASTGLGIGLGIGLAVVSGIGYGLAAFFVQRTRAAFGKKAETIFDEPKATTSSVQLESRELALARRVQDLVSNDPIVTQLTSGSMSPATVAYDQQQKQGVGQQLPDVDVNAQNVKTQAKFNEELRGLQNKVSPV